MKKETEENSTQHPIAKKLINWYSEHGRDLPWRKSSNSYHIWISEVILQQTRIAQGIDYYHRFIKHFPDVSSLAAASEEEVLKIWQGLGYYSRARNLHQAAHQIVSQHNGQIPTSHTELLSLKGIGEYTAAAISSIAFSQPHAVVDGNVYRVLTRLFAIELAIDTSSGKKMIAEIAYTLLPKENPGRYNQAIMDFGAMICTPTQPKCDECVLQDMCLAYEAGKVSYFPIKARKTKVRNRYFHYLHILHGNYTYLQKREQKDIWRNLYEFPLIETDQPADLTYLQATKEFRDLFSSVTDILITPTKRMQHQLTHQLIHTQFYQINVSSSSSFTPPLKFISTIHTDIHSYPISRLIQKYLETI